MAYLSGRQSSEGQQFGTYSQDDVDALRALAEEPGIVDLFLTYPCFLICCVPFSSSFSFLILLSSSTSSMVRLLDFA